MSEEKKSIRLQKAAKEFNISIGTAVEFLHKKGFAEIEANPNTKISEGEYDLLLKEFQKDKSLKEEAEKINLDLPHKKKMVSIDEVIKPKEMEEQEKEEDLIFIKGKTVAFDFPHMASKDSELPIKEIEQEKSKNEVPEAANIETPEPAPVLPEKLEVKKSEKKIPAEKDKKEEEALEMPREEAKKKEEIKEEPQKEVKEEPKEEIKEEIKEESKVETKPKEEAIKEAKKEISEEAKEEIKPEKEILPIQETLIIEEKPIANEKTQEPVKEVEVPVEIQESQAEVISETEVSPTPEVEEEAKPSGPRIVGTIDLSSLNTRTRPDKKTKEELKKDAKEKKHAEKKHQDTHRVEASKPAEPKTEKPIQTVPVQKNASVAPAPVSAPAPVKEGVEKEDNFIKTEYVKLEGPKSTGQRIDLSQFEKKKPVASSKENPTHTSQNNKKKRKRIQDEQAKPAQGGGNASQGAKGSGGDRPWLKKEHPGGSHAGSHNAHGAASKNNKKKKKEPLVVDQGEIEKQIKETLARLTPLGKSKTSKHRREKRQNINSLMMEEKERMLEEEKVLKVTEFVTVNELATMMNIPVNKIISTCMSLGLFVSINQRLTADPITLLAEEFGFSVEFVDAEVLDGVLDQEEEGELIDRTPIVTVMGHVDHGKTSLLDYIRNTNVIAGEAGGITQHIGAYEVSLENAKKITFLDTPGHEAFTAMRARGAKITDIAIIVISADDRIMPQTVEAINHAQAAGVPLVFAINKIDKAGANPDKIKEELANMNLLIEEWGGKYQSQDISAKKGTNVDLLLEKVLLEAELLSLQACPEKRAIGTVIDSALDKGRGYITKILVQDGSVSLGDNILAGSYYGRVKAMYNERNQPIKKAGPSTPIVMLGLNGAPQAGDSFNVTPTEKDAKDIANKRQQLHREQGLRTQKHITLDEIGRRIAIGDFKELNIILKGDVDGSIEALADSLLKLSSPEVQVNVIHKSVGQISESDVLLASASEAVIIGFQVRPSMNARKLAESEQIDIRLYSIIYDAINEVKDAIEGMLSPEIQERITCNLEVREVFRINKVGAVAGCFVMDGKINRQTRVRIIRDGIVVYTGKLSSLKRFKDDVKEAVVGQDCGLSIENFNDIKENDVIEGYETQEVKRSL